MSRSPRNKICPTTLSFQAGSPVGSHLTPCPLPVPLAAKKTKVNATLYRHKRCQSKGKVNVALNFSGYERYKDESPAPFNHLHQKPQSENTETAARIETDPGCEPIDEVDSIKRNIVRESLEPRSIQTILNNVAKDFEKYSRTCEQRPRCLSTFGIVDPFSRGYNRSPGMRDKLTKGFSFRCKPPPIPSQHVPAAENLMSKEVLNWLPQYDPITVAKDHLCEKRYGALKEYMERTYAFNAPPTPKMSAQRPIKAASKNVKYPFLKSKFAAAEKSAPALMSTATKDTQETRKTTASFSTMSPTISTAQQLNSVGYTDALGEFWANLSPLYYESLKEVLQEHKTTYRQYQDLNKNLGTYREKAIEIVLEIAMKENERAQQGIGKMFTDEDVYTALRIGDLLDLKEKSQSGAYNGFCFPFCLLCN